MNPHTQNKKLSKNLTHVRIKVNMLRNDLPITSKQTNNFHPKPCSISPVGRQPWGGGWGWGWGSKRGKCNSIHYCLTPSPFGQVAIPLRPALGPPSPEGTCHGHVPLNLIKGSSPMVKPTKSTHIWQWHTQTQCG